MDAYHAVSPSDVKLLPSRFQTRETLNTQYLLSLKNRNLLQNYYLEARILSHQFRNTTHGDPGRGDDWHWGWESPTCQLRGHFLGHWLSGIARTYASTGDPLLKARVDQAISELARCQEQNGGEWAGSIPPDYLEWTARGQPTWAPHYVVHKTLMGLHDAYTLADNQQALDIAVNWARWFHRWTGRFGRAELDDLLDVETGGMLEAWANLYSVTGDLTHLALLERYNRPRLFEPLRQGADVLTNMHANTTVPEAQGAARAYEVTGDDRWREIAEAYWDCAVTNRGYYCTGGQTDGEIWSPPFKLSARLGAKTQEHCVVYNMIRLADYLLRWTGEAAYADYIERNTYNGILAQQHPETGMIAYWLPLAPGSAKIWGSPTNDFWCCHGSLVQAHSCHNAYIYYTRDDALLVSQYIPSELTWEKDDAEITVRQIRDHQTGDAHRVSRMREATERPGYWVIAFRIHTSTPVEFALKLRLPWWLSGPAMLTLNGQSQMVEGESAGWYTIRRLWHDDHLRLALPKAVSTCPLPDAPNMVAFMDGPVVLAGLCDEERRIDADRDEVTSLLVPDHEREWDQWQAGWRLRDQPRGLRFKPLYEITDERYTVYFPLWHQDEEV